MSLENFPKNELPKGPNYLSVLSSSAPPPLINHLTDACLSESIFVHKDKFCFDVHNRSHLLPGNCSERHRESVDGSSLGWFHRVVDEDAAAGEAGREADLLYPLHHYQYPPQCRVSAIQKYSTLYCIPCITISIPHSAVCLQYKSTLHYTMSSASLSVSTTAPCVYNTKVLHTILYPLHHYPPTAIQVCNSSL